MEIKHKIAIDLDDTLLDFVNPFLNLLKENHNLEGSYDTWKDYYFSRTFNITHAEAVKILEEYFASEKFGDLDLLPYAKESILELFNEFELNFITARPEIHTKEKTEKNLNKHFPDLDYNLFFAGENNNFKEKHEICSEKDIKLIVEDHGAMALVYANSGLKVILFNHPWNQGVEHENIFRVENWKQAAEEIKGFFKKITGELEDGI